MNWQMRSLELESLENRELLDVGLGSEIADFATESDLKTALMDKAVAQHEWKFGQELEDWRWGPWPVDCPNCFAVPDIALPSADLDAAIGAPEVAEPDFSDTNVQVAGVDEGDIVETDGHYVYVLSGNQVTVVDVRDQDHPRIASRVHLSSTNDFFANANEMYLDDDRLMVVSSGSGFFVGPEPGFGLVADLWLPSPQKTVVTVIDVSDRDDARILSETHIDGSVTNSRAIDGTGYFIVSEGLAYPEPIYKEVTLTSEDGEIERTVNIYETEEEYRERVEPGILESMPNYSTYDKDRVLTEEGNVSDFTTTFSTNDPNYGSIVSVVTIDMQEDLPAVDTGTTVLMSTGHEIFMSLDSLYLFQNRWDLNDATSIMKFDVNRDEGSVLPTASGVVSGHMLDQFSADERGGDLRVATTTGWGNESSSGVYVLEETEDDKLAIKGAVAGLAKGERIFSARFVGTQAYIVTFRQVDPLFSIDLSNPAEPEVLGELKIPGFSEYMQPIDENTLLAIGRDADPITGRSEGLQLSLFDVTDRTDPRLVDRFTFEGGRSTYSPAEYDHHAFSYFPDYEVLAVPVQSQDGGAWIRTLDSDRFWVPATWNQAVHVFEIDKEEGFQFTGAVEHPSEVRRTVRVDEKIYTISRDTVKVSPIDSPTEVIGQVHYLPPANGGVVPKQPLPIHVDRVFEAAASLENPARFDMDGNELVNSDDVAFLVEAAAQSNLGDTNLDGKVNFVDFLQLSQNYGDEGGWEDGDFDGSGVIDFADFTILSANYGGFQA